MTEIIRYQAAKHLLTHHKVGGRDWTDPGI